VSEDTVLGGAVTALIGLGGLERVELGRVTRFGLDDREVVEIRTDVERAVLDGREKLERWLEEVDREKEPARMRPPLLLAFTSAPIVSWNAPMSGDSLLVGNSRLIPLRSIVLAASK
jgi:hypothetical protein